jgi:hypothetical protein
MMVCLIHWSILFLWEVVDTHIKVSLTLLQIAVSFTFLLSFFALGLASGTNASTDQDHTAYTLTTAGSTGFFKTLPVFIDHLLCPLLTVITINFLKNTLVINSIAITISYRGPPR